MYLKSDTLDRNKLGDDDAKNRNDQSQNRTRPEKGS